MTKSNNPLHWEKVETGVLFECAGSERRVEVEALADGPIAAWLDMTDADGVVTAVLLDYWAGGKKGLNFVIHHNAALRFEGAASRSVFVKGIARSAVVAAADEASFASPYMGKRQNDEVSRMMYIMKLNEQRREQRMKHDLDLLAAERKRVAEEQAAIEAARIAAEAVIDDPAS